MGGWLRRLRARIRYGRFDEDLRHELDVHRAMSEDALAAAGADRASARAGAARALGNVAIAREDARRVWLGPWLERIGQDIRHAVRGFRRAPAFTAFALLTLALGIGGTTAVFSVVDGVLLKPLPYPDPDRLVDVRQSVRTPSLPDAPLGAWEYVVFRDRSRGAAEMGIFLDGGVTVTGRGTPQRVRGVRVTDGVLPALGVAPALGRLLTRDDDRPNAPPVAVVTAAYWRDRLGSDPGIVGRSLVLDATPTTIVGVMPASFRFINIDDAAFFLPLRLDRGALHLGELNYSLIARLRPGVTAAAFDRELTGLAPEAIQQFPPPPGFSTAMFEQAGFQVHARALKQAVVGDVGHVLWIVMGTIAFVLLIACANVGNLLLVRAEGRRRELAVRAALGAGSRRIATSLLVESVVLGLAGGALGLVVAAGAIRLLVGMAPTGLPRLYAIGVDARSVLFTAGISILAGVLFGCAPILRRDRGLNVSLRSGDRTASASRAQQRARGALVVVQVALALVVLVSSGLMIRTYVALTRVDPGFTAPDAVETFWLSVPPSEISDLARVGAVQEDLLQRLAAIPGVSAAGLSNDIPMSGRMWWDSVAVEGRTYAVGELPPLRRFTFMSPGFRQALGGRLVAGRDLTWADVQTGSHVVLVSENMAREVWGSSSAALGRRIRLTVADNPWREVIGVVADVRTDGVTQPAPTTVYWPMRMDVFGLERPFALRDFAIALRTDRAGTQALLADVRQAVSAAHSALPIVDARTLDSYARQSMARTSFMLVMLLIAGGIALLLGVVGLYSVIAYAVAQRTREIGIRAALGARPAQLAGAFVRSGLLLTVVGLTGGMAAALALSRLMASVLFGVSPFDPTTYLGVSAALIATTCLASYIPARRALRIDPASTLRQE